MWLDKVSARQVLQLRDQFNIKQLFETGSAEGNNAIFYARYFEWVFSCDVDKELVKRAYTRAQGIPNVSFAPLESDTFLTMLTNTYKWECRNDTVMVILDAHTPKNWPLQRELAALEGFPHCVVVIHDFKVKDMGYVSYDGQDLDFDYVREPLLRINPNFHFFTNSRDTAEIVTIEEVQQGKVPGILNDEWAIDRLKYAWSAPVKTYRGILYAVPSEHPATDALFPIEKADGDAEV